MELLPKHTVIDSRYLAANVVASKELTFLAVELNIRDFQQAIVVQTTGEAAEMVGYAGFLTGHPSHLAVVDPTLMELRMLKVDPQYFQRGIGRELLGLSHAYARSMSKRLVLQPERPGKYAAGYIRREEYPLTDEQLREMYKRHGFRELTPDEYERYVQLVMDDRFSGNLWFAGINPDTAEFTQAERHKMTREEKALLSHIPFETKVRLEKGRLARNGHSSAFASYERAFWEIVGKYLIEDESELVKDVV